MIFGYSCRGFIYQKDKLFVIVGLVCEIQNIIGVIYVGGIWIKDLICSLNWVVCEVNDVWVCFDIYRVFFFFWVFLDFLIFMDFEDYLIGYVEVLEYFVELKG